MAQSSHCNIPAPGSWPPSLRMLPHVFCVYRTEEGFCPRQMDQGVDAGVVIRMGVGHDDIFQVLGIEAQLPDVVDQAGHAGRRMEYPAGSVPPRYRSGGGAPEIPTKYRLPRI